MLVADGPVLLLARHRPLHPLRCPVAVVCGAAAAAAAAVYSSVGIISCSGARRLHGGVHRHSRWWWWWKTALHGELFCFYCMAVAWKGKTLVYLIDETEEEEEEEEHDHGMYTLRALVVTGC